MACVTANWLVFVLCFLFLTFRFFDCANLFFDRAQIFWIPQPSPTSPSKNLEIPFPMLSHTSYTSNSVRWSFYNFHSKLSLQKWSIVWSVPIWRGLLTATMEYILRVRHTKCALYGDACVRPKPQACCHRLEFFWGWRDKKKISPLLSYSFRMLSTSDGYFTSGRKVPPGACTVFALRMPSALRRNLPVPECLKALLNSWWVSLFRPFWF